MKENVKSRWKEGRRQIRVKKSAGYKRSAGLSWVGQGRAGQGKARQGRAGQGRARQGKVGQDRT